MTQISSRRDPESRVEVAIIPGPNASEEHKQKLAKCRPAGLSPQAFRAEFPRILHEVNAAMGIRADPSSREGVVFSADVLKIEVFGPNEDLLTVIDVPGIFRTPTDGVTTDDDMKLVRSMVNNYTKAPRTIILAVIPSNVDAATQEILTLAKAVDPGGERTIGVLTKPDLVTERSAQTAVCGLVLGKKHTLVLGYYVVRNRGADEDETFDASSAERLFNEEPWNSLPSNRVGIRALKAQLTALLMQITRREFPALRMEISKRLTQCRAELTSLGPARQTEHEQRMYLSTMAARFQELTRAALDAYYANYREFDENPKLRLITHVANMCEEFNRIFENEAHFRHFDKVKKEEDTEESGEGVGFADDEVLDQTQVEDEEVSDQIQDEDEGNEDLERFPILESIICRRRCRRAPRGGIMAWIKELYSKARGVDLGGFGGTVLASAFRAQSAKWEPITKTFVGDVILLLHEFILTVLHLLCADKRICDEIWSSISDDVLSRYGKGMEHAVFLLKVEREKKPFTLNHYFNANLQKCRSDRLINAVKGSARKESMRKSNGHFYGEGPLMVELKLLENLTIHEGNVEHTTEEIHDILKSYYKVARKRFADNVYHQAVDHFLLTGENSPLRVFSQEWVIGLVPEQLEAIAGEEPGIRERRRTLHKTIEDLEAAIGILKH